MRTKIVLVACGLILTLTAMPGHARGQVVGQPYRLSDKEVTRLLDRIKSKTNTFRDSLKKTLNKSRMDRTREKDDVNAYVKAFEEETKRLDDHFDHHQSTTADVDSVLQRAARIDTFMRLHPVDARTQAAWETLRSDLEQLAPAYNISCQWSV